jgi:hypothetical protein
MKNYIRKDFFLAMDIENVRMEKIGKNIKPCNIVILCIKFLILPFNIPTKIIIQIVLINVPNPRINRNTVAGLFCPCILLPS